MSTRSCSPTSFAPRLERVFFVSIAIRSGRRTKSRDPSAGSHRTYRRRHRPPAHGRSRSHAVRGRMPRRCDAREPSARCRQAWRSALYEPGRDARCLSMIPASSARQTPTREADGDGGDHRQHSGSLAASTVVRPTILGLPLHREQGRAISRPRQVLRCTVAFDMTRTQLGAVC